MNMSDLSDAMDVLEQMAVKGAETEVDSSLYKAEVYGALACVREHLEPVVAHAMKTKPLARPCHNCAHTHGYAAPSGEWTRIICAGCHVEVGTVGQWSWWAK